MKIIDYIDESFDYIRFPEYFLFGTVFCVGVGLSTFGMSVMGPTSEFIGYPLLLTLGGIGLTVWSLSMLYTLYSSKLY